MDEKKTGSYASGKVDDVIKMPEKRKKKKRFIEGCR